jgi:hypothetical protein
MTFLKIEVGKTIFMIEIPFKIGYNEVNQKIKEIQN